MVVAAGLLVVVLAGVAQLTAMAVAATRTSAVDTVALLLASQKLEQLRSLPWRFDPGGRRVTDRATDLTRDPPGSRGTGLTPSPRDSLTRSTPGYVDYLDEQGRWIGTGTAPVVGTAFVRRWSIQPGRIGGQDTIILDVIVTPLGPATTRVPASRSPDLPGAVGLTTLRVRD